MHETKTDYYCADIQTNAKDSKLLFKTVDTLLHKSGEPPLPACDSPSHLANTFQDYFLERVALIHQGIQATLTDLDLAASLWGPEELPAACSLTYFRLATHDDIRQMVSKAPPKSCELDPIPTWLLKQCGDGIIPSMTSVINMSLESGVVPGCFKRDSIASRSIYLTSGGSTKCTGVLCMNADNQVPHNAEVRHKKC